MSPAELYRSLGIGAVEPRNTPEREPIAPKSPGLSDFEKVLRQHNEPAGSGALKFSQHAETRIKSRSIPWNEDLERRVNHGLDSAREKGSRETLILAGDVAVIANVKSRTVITAMDANNLKERIFTNIDSAVIV